MPQSQLRDPEEPCTILKRQQALLQYQSKHIPTAKAIYLPSPHKRSTLTDTQEEVWVSLCNLLTPPQNQHLPALHRKTHSCTSLRQHSVHVYMYATGSRGLDTCTLKAGVVTTAIVKRDWLVGFRYLRSWTNWDNNKWLQLLTIGLFGLIGSISKQGSRRQPQTLHMYTSQWTQHRTEWLPTKKHNISLPVRGKVTSGDTH